ncbi:DUF2169 family type VI secretion system accessory protein [Sorangium cellulosum]|uniref:DUF2169 domain-containing protein n=1 Tax=Sorangium cellulosum So0157-2 TaxID=1254432 RepID=S4XH01_SORCE|nr:DUF2169 domain-containing protein [Sorangium cellulosum]AGP32397.1 hypothetical protein SCE1572_19500 [Sorangium cellulosum So0157-2]
MLVQNLTPFLCGIKRVFRSPPRPEMSIVVRGSFVLRPGEALAPIEDPAEQASLTAEVFREDDEERRGECLYGGDFADVKRNAEVLLKARCHAPGKRPVAECTVLFGVGAWSKALRVIGRRVWTERMLGPAISEPAPFVSMPITWANAFGGPEYAMNPVGKGYRTPELPTVELPGQPIRSRADTPAPAGFGPINPGWPQRVSKVGKAYGRRYLTERAPWYADDFDVGYFHAAPDDQQLRGYLRGDEELTFQNLHPEHATLKARLPGLAVRAFVRGREGELREVPMALDTLYADLDVGRVALTWRGLSPVREDDLSDVAGVLVVAEALGGERGAEAGYGARLDAFLEDPAGIRAAAPPGFLEAAERQRRRDAGEEVPPMPGSEGLDPISRVIQDRLGGVAAGEQQKIREAIELALGGARKQAELEAAVAAASAPAPPAPVNLKPGAAPAVGLRRVMRQVLAQAAEARRSLAGRELAAEQRERLAAMEQMPHDPRWRELDPDYTPPVEPLSTGEPGPGSDLRERDLTGRDLRGADLRGADLREAILTRADLRGADLRGAKLRAAILFQADLSGADLSGADLTRANAAEARAEGARFEEAILDQIFLEGGKLRGATLLRARGEYAALRRADLSDAALGGAALARADLSESTLDRADLAGATLARTSLEGCSGAQVNLVGADLGGANLAGAALAGARLEDARADRSNWTGATLDGADLGFATLRGALLTRASLAGARLFGADLRHARLDRANLERADLTRANLFEADLGKARIGGARFAGASLYGAALLGAAGAGADFTGANLKRSTRAET